MLQVELPPGFSEERRYALHVVLTTFLGVEHRVAQGSAGSVCLRAGRDNSVRVADVFLRRAATAWLAPSSLPVLPLAEFALDSVPFPVKALTRTLPIVYGESVSEGRFIAVTNGAVQLGIDIFGTAFFFLSRYEELVTRERDARDRFPAAASFAARANLFERPIVDEYVELLWSALVHAFPWLERRKRVYAVAPSHDVDHPFMGKETQARALANAVLDIAVQRDPALAFDRLHTQLAGATLRSSRDPHDRFDFIMDQSERHGLTSTFHFIARSGSRSVDASYALDDARTAGLMRKIHARGHRIGLHPSYDCYLDGMATREDASHLRNTAAGLGIEQTEWTTRQHYLRFRAPATWQHLADAGLDRDSTLAFHDRVGFRCGTCHEFPVFNLETKRMLALREQPLIVMEVACLKYMRLDLERCVELSTRLARACRLFDGTFELLWHNTTLLTRRQQASYVELLSAVC